MIELPTSPDALSELSPVAPPKLLSQARDTSRDNLMVYVKADDYLRTETSDPSFMKSRCETTEYKALNEFLYFMKMVEPYVPDHIKDDARELRNELVFFGHVGIAFCGNSASKKT